MVPVIGDDGSASGPLVISVLLGIAVYGLFFRDETASPAESPTEDSSPEPPAEPAAMDIGKVVNDAFTNGSKATAAAVSCEEQGKPVSVVVACQYADLSSTAPSNMPKRPHFLVLPLMWSAGSREGHPSR